MIERYLARILATGLCLMMMAFGTAQAQQLERNILTGGPSGTYIKFGRDIAGLAAACGITLNVRESAGSLENFLGVRNRPQTQFGIVQSDVLEYMKTYAADDPAIARALTGVRIAFPLYNEEVHILARKDIPDLAGLAGKRVAIGVQDSGTFLTASLILDLAKVQPAERVMIGPNESLTELLAGRIDAFFYVAGAPAELFNSTQIDANAYHLLPISDPVLKTVYVPAQIAGGTYPFQADPVDVVAVKAVLMTYEYDTRRNAYHRASCNAVAEVSHLILTQIDELKASGHPKWKSVELNAIPPGWDIGACVNAGLAPDFQMQCMAPKAPPAEAPGDSGANAAYRARICATIGC